MINSREWQHYYRIMGNITKDNGNKTLLTAMGNILGQTETVILATIAKGKEVDMESCTITTEISLQGTGKTGLSKAMELTLQALHRKQEAGYEASLLKRRTQVD